MAYTPDIKIRDLLEAGVHYGHKTSRWNPRMSPYIFGARDNIHIIDLQKTLPLMQRALNKIYDVTRNNGRVLFVGTKRQASPLIAEAAKNSGQYYVNHRWLGGMLTNWKTVSRSIRKLKELQAFLDKGEFEGYTKKEILGFRRQHEKLFRSLGGITEMGGRPDIIFLIDSNKEDLAMSEAAILNIPVIAVLDSNSDPTGVAYPIPGNDDATRSVELYCRLAQEAALAGIQESLSASGIDIGAAENPEEAKAAAKPRKAKAAPAKKAKESAEKPASNDAEANAQPAPESAAPAEDAGAETGAPEPKAEASQG